MKHLVKELHDVTCMPVSIWCDADQWMGDCTGDVWSATCQTCLLVAFLYKRWSRGRSEAAAKAEPPR